MTDVDQIFYLRVNKQIRPIGIDDFEQLLIRKVFMVKNSNQVEVAGIFSMRRKQYITRSASSSSAIFNNLELDTKVIVLDAPVVH